MPSRGKGTTMLGSAKKFLKNRGGAFAIQFALLALPLTVCTGLAIDGGRAFLARFELASALDAAALAVGSTYADGADLDAIAQSFVDANFKTPHNGAIQLTLTPDDDIITLSGTVKIDTYFMPLVGQPHVTVSAESEVRRGGANVEVALALDITQSMSGSKISALRTAAKDLIDEVVNDDQSPFFSRIAIAPWGTNLHAGALAAALRGPVAGPTAITGAHWRVGSSKTISGATWRVGTAKTVSSATWRNGSAATISVITKVTSPTPAKIRVTTSANHGYTTGQYVRITGANGSYTSLNNNTYALEVVNSTQYYLRNLANTAYVTPPGGSTNASAGASQRCFNSSCEIQVTTSSSHSFSAGDKVHVTGVGSPYGAVNNAAGSPWTVGSTPAPASTTFMLSGSNGPAITSTSNGSGGSASECITATCEVQVTATSHGFSNGDYVYVSSVGGMTPINNSTGTTWSIGSVATNTFILPGTLGPNYSDYSSGGSAQECYNSTCQVKISSTAHGLAANDYVEVSSVGGFTGANTTATQVASATTNEFYLTGWGPSLSNSSTAYTSNTGSAQCLNEGCQKYRFQAADNSYQIKAISNCVTERTGAQAATDAAPGANAWLGRDYAGSGSLVTCNTGNYITPLTDDKDKLKDTIDDMVVSGSTAGQIGAGWAWYLLSQNWDGVFTGADYDPVPKTTPYLNRVAVFMTDGEFNTAHCNGVTTQTYAYSSVSNSDRIKSSVCTASDTPFNQAQAICTAMKADSIVIYTIGFEVGSAAGAADFLTQCATDPSHYYQADDAEELKSAFKEIAKAISRLRISR